MIADVPAKVMLDDEQGVDDFAQRDSLTKAPAAPFLVLRADRIIPGIADPGAQISVKAPNARLEFLTEDRLKRLRSGIRGDACTTSRVSPSQWLSMS